MSSMMFATRALVATSRSMNDAPFSLGYECVGRTVKGQAKRWHHAKASPTRWRVLHSDACLARNVVRVSASRTPSHPACGRCSSVAGAHPAPSGQSPEASSRLRNRASRPPKKGIYFCASPKRERQIEMIMGQVGIEPTHPFGSGILSPMRLPIPPLPQVRKTITSLRWAKAVGTAFLPGACVGDRRHRDGWLFYSRSTRMTPWVRSAGHGDWGASDRLERQRRRAPGRRDTVPLCTRP